MTDEEFYDTEIAQSLISLAEKCIARGMAFAARAQWEGGSAVVEQAPHERWPGTRLVQYAHRANGNADALIAMIANDARKHGYESAALILLELRGKVPEVI